MKPLFLLCLSLAIFSYSHSQKIEENKFDKFDSSYRVTLKKEVWTMRMTPSQAIWLRVEKFKIVSSDQNSIFADIIFIPGKVTSIDKNSYVKIEFKDGSIKQYDQFLNEYHLYGSNDFATISIHIPADDDLFIKDINSVRVSTSSLIRDYDIKDKKSDLMKKMLALVRDTQFKK